MRSVFDRRTASAALAAAVTLLASRPRADDRAIDPAYGRVDGDIGVVLGVGGAVAPRGPRAEAEVRLRYLETAGLFATYEAGVLGSASEPQRVFTGGLELRPLFLFRWLKGHETGHARFDLAVDSLGLELGAVVHEPQGTGLAWQGGFEVGLGVELPILERATGPWIGIRGLLRWSEAALASGIVSNADDRQAVLVVTLAWHQIVTWHVADLGDRGPD
jgi:hypothetical protein